jgi:hypothetical protein
MCVCVCVWERERERCMYSWPALKCQQLACSPRPRYLHPRPMIWILFSFSNTELGCLRYVFEVRGLLNLKIKVCYWMIQVICSSL